MSEIIPHSMAAGLLPDGAFPKGQTSGLSATRPRLANSPDTVWRILEETPMSFDNLLHGRAR